MEIGSGKQTRAKTQKVKAQHRSFSNLFRSLYTYIISNTFYIDYSINRLILVALNHITWYVSF